MSRSRRVGRRRSSLILKADILHTLKLDERDHAAIGWIPQQSQKSSQKGLQDSKDSQNTPINYKKRQHTQTRKS